MTATPIFRRCGCSLVLFFIDTATTEIYTLSLHDALPILQADLLIGAGAVAGIETSAVSLGELGPAPRFTAAAVAGTISIKDADRKSTRLNSSHMSISYAVFCLKKKKNI